MAISWNIFAYNWQTHTRAKYNAHISILPDDEYEKCKVLRGAIGAQRGNGHIYRTDMCMGIVLLHWNIHTDGRTK